MLTKADLETRLAGITIAHGEWTYDIPLLHGVWTRGNEGVPHTRLRRLLQISRDLGGKPLSDCRVLDLGCLDGQFAIEFGLHGAEVVGVDAREANLQKAVFARDVLGLERVQFIHDDVRHASLDRFGRFDVILCSGLLYHLNTPDVFDCVERMYEMAEKLLIIDTHISLSPDSVATYHSRDYHGHYWREHAPADPEEVKAARLRASWGNDVSFMMTRPSLVNLLSHVGFSSVYECFNPPHLNFGQPGLEHQDRCTFVALKGEAVEVHTSPAATTLQEDHPEESLAYPLRPPTAGGVRSRVGALVGRLRAELKRLSSR